MSSSVAKRQDLDIIGGDGSNKIRTFGMLLTCVKCETIFKIDAGVIPRQGRRVRCTVCDHVWSAQPMPYPVPPASPEPTPSSGQGKLIGFLAIIILLVGLGVYRHTITAIAPVFTPIYQSLGMDISANLQAVEVQKLKAERQRNIIHISGDLANTSSWPVHAPQLHLVVSNAFGHSLQEETIRLDKGIIAAKEVLHFAHQLTLEMNLADDVVTEITVTPANRDIHLP